MQSYHRSITHIQSVNQLILLSNLNLNLNYFIGELRHAFDVSKPKIVFVSKATEKNVTAVCANLPYVQKIISIDGETNDKVTSLNEFIKIHSQNDFNVLEFVRKSVDLRSQSAVIFLSSGTTGNPKGNFVIFIKL